MNEEIRKIHLRQDDFEKRLFRNEEMYADLKASNEKILLVLKPISDTYAAAGILRKWVSAFVIGVITLTSAIIGVREVIKLFNK